MAPYQAPYMAPYQVPYMALYEAHLFTYIAETVYIL